MDENPEYEPVVGPDGGLTLHLTEDGSVTRCAIIMKPPRLWRRWGIPYNRDELDWVVDGNVCRDCLATL